MSFYSLTSYSQLRVNKSALGGGGTPPFSNTLSTTFDGTDDFCETATTYSELDGQNKATISFWIKPPSVISNLQIVASVIKNATASNHQFEATLRTNGTIQISMDTGSRYIRASTTPLNLNAWNHVLFCFDTTQVPSVNRGRVFINGVDATSATTVSGVFSTATGGLYIAENQNGQYNNFNGGLDEFAIWAGTDQRANVSEIYSASGAVDLNTLATAPNPTTWYRMGDNDTYPTILDKNGSVNLTMTNMSSANFVTDVPPNPAFSNTLSTLFDGVDDSVSMSSNINLGTTSSVSFWIKRNDTAIAQPLGHTTAWSDRLVRLQTTKIEFGSVAFIFNNATTLSTINQTTDWTHLLFVRTGATCNLYVNGVNNDGAKTNANASWINKFRVIGAPGDGTTWAFNGLIDEVSLFTTALSSSDATAIYNGGVPTSLTSYSPLGFWRMGDGSTYPTINDVGSGGNNGTMTAMSSANFVTDVPT